MNGKRIGAVGIMVLTLMLWLGQSSAGAQSSPPPPPHSGFSATINQPNSQAPFKITVQGRLTDPSGNPITIATNFTFRLYTLPNGGGAIFTEGPISLTPDSNGLVTYYVGSATTIDPNTVAQFANSLYLGVTVGSDAEMTPRILLSAAPYAMSLAPGALVSGNYTGVSGRYGVINAVNSDHSNSYNAGLYSAGATGVLAEAYPSGSAWGFGGHFENFGGSSGQQVGVAGIAHPAGGSYGIGGYFYNYGGGSSTQYGVYAQNVITGTPSGVGGYFNNSGAGSGTQYGLFASNTTTGGTTSFGGQFVNYGGGSGDQVGIDSSVVHNGSSPSFAGTFDNFGGSPNNVQFGVYATTVSTSTQYSMSGFFANYGNASAARYGVHTFSPGFGLHAQSNGNTNSQQSAAVVGENSTASGAGGVFTSTGSSGVGVVGVGGTVGGSGGQFSGYTGVLANGGGATQPAYNDGLDVGGSGGISYAMYSIQPSGDTNYTLYGTAHIHGSNISAADYSVEVVYHDSSPAQIGDVLALDGNNTTRDGATVLGVVRASSVNVKAAIGVLDKRLDTVKVNGMDKTVIDGSATSIHSGDRAYIVVMGSARMKVAGNPSLGDDLTLDRSGKAVIADDNARHTIGKIASSPDKDGYVTVFVNLK